MGAVNGSLEGFGRVGGDAVGKKFGGAARRARRLLRAVLFGVTLGGVGVAGLTMPTTPSPAADKAPKVAFSSERAAYSQGLGGFRSGNLDIAVPALQFAAERGVLAARSYLARIYADEKSAYSDHARAYRLFRSIVETHGDVDPDDTRTAPYVAHAWTALGEYMRDGVPALKIAADLDKAAAYFQYAAQEYNNRAAQFELAKLYLERFKSDQKVRLALHWLAVLSRKGNVGAQVYLADLMWRGKFTKKDPKRALALISVAGANASPHDRDWIEDIHQTIYCGTEVSVRLQASKLFDNWRKKYSGPTIASDKLGLAALGARPLRICGDGQVVAAAGVPAGKPSSTPVETAPAAPRLRQHPALDRDLSVLFGGLAMTGSSFTSVTGPHPAPKK
jgi:TPR repeat protein